MYPDNCTSTSTAPLLLLSLTLFPAVCLSHSSSGFRLANLTLTLRGYVSASRFDVRLTATDSLYTRLDADEIISEYRRHVGEFFNSAETEREPVFKRTHARVDATGDEPR